MRCEYKHKVMLYEIAESFFKDLVQYDSETGEMLNEADIQEELKGVRDEIKHVYSQATKAEEYETKAEAFDEIVEKYEEIMRKVRNRKFKVVSDVTLLGLEAEKVIKKYESGEPNE